MDTKSIYFHTEDSCPVLDMECPAGHKSSRNCSARFNSRYFDPLHNWRDNAILCCAGERIDAAKEQEDLPPLV